MCLALLLTMKARVGQSTDCFCSPAGFPYDYCFTRGCSLGNNSDCNPDSPHGVIRYSDRYDDYANGCNCPISPSTNISANYIPGGFPDRASTYYYTTCTGYGGNAPDVYGYTPAARYNATDCCNFCCDRTDPYPIITTTITITTTAITTATTTAATTASTGTTAATTVSTGTTAATTASTGTTAATTATTTSGGEIILNKSLYLSGLAMLILATLKIN